MSSQSAAERAPVELNRESSDAEPDAPGVLVENSKSKSVKESFQPSARLAPETRSTDKRFSTSPAAAALAARASQGANAQLPSRDVTLPFHTFRNISRLKTSKETESETIVRAIRWLDAIDTLAKITDYKTTRFSLEELKKAAEARHQMNMAGFAEEKTRAIMKGVFCGDSEDDLQTAFDHLDESGSGHITRHQLREALPMMGEKIHRDDADKLVNFIDSDQSGTIEFPEFCTLVRELNPKDGYNDGSADIFSGFLSSFDETLHTVGNSAADTYAAFASASNANLNVGVTSMRSAGSAMNRMKEAGANDEEARALCEAYYSDQTEEQLKLSFAKLDKDCSGGLDKKELQKLMPLLEETPPEHMDELFRAVDRNKSGRVEFAEFVMLIEAISKRQEGDSWGIGEAWGKVSSSWFG